MFFLVCPTEWAAADWITLSCLKTPSSPLCLGISWRHGLFSFMLPSRRARSFWEGPSTPPPVMSYSWRDAGCSCRTLVVIVRRGGRVLCWLMGPGLPSPAPRPVIRGMSLPRQLRGSWILYSHADTLFQKALAHTHVVISPCNCWVVSPVSAYLPYLCLCVRACSPTGLVCSLKNPESVKGWEDDRDELTNLLLV